MATTMTMLIVTVIQNDANDTDDDLMIIMITSLGRCSDD